MSTLLKHRCHAYLCGNARPPRWLMCKQCWRLVSPATQAEVYRTVKLRNPRCDRTWAPWWRAQAKAKEENFKARGLTFAGDSIEAQTQRAMDFADRLEASSVPRPIGAEDVTP